MMWRRNIAIFLAGIALILFFSPSFAADKGEPSTPLKASVPALESSKTFVSIEKIYLKDDIVWVNLKKEGDGKLSKIGKLYLNLGKGQRHMSLNERELLRGLNEGKIVKYDTGLKITERSMARVSIGNASGNAAKSVMLTPMEAMGAAATDPVSSDGAPAQTPSHKRSKKDDRSAFAESTQNESHSSSSARSEPGVVGTAVIIPAAGDEMDNHRTDHHCCPGVSAVSYGINANAAETTGESNGSYNIFWQATPRYPRCEEWTIFIYCGPVRGSLPEYAIHLSTDNPEAFRYDAASGVYTFSWNEPMNWPTDCDITLEVIAGYRPSPP